MFGQPAASTAPKFFGFSPTTTTTPAAVSSSPSLFGTPIASTSSNLFGGSTPKPTTGSLFGSTTGSNSLFGTTSSATTGGLFGFTQPQQQQQSSNTNTNNFFGGQPTTTTTTSAGGGLFGAAGGSGGGGGLFGGSFGAAGAAATKPSLFGAPTQQQQQQQGAGGLQFSSTTPTTTMNQQQQPQRNLNKLTKFNDLPENIRSVIEGIDSFVKQQVQLSEQLKKKELGEEIEKTRNEWLQCSADATALSSLLHHSSNSVNGLRNRLDQDAQDVEKATWIVEGYKNPQGPKAPQAKSVQTFPFEFFKKKTDEFEARLMNYKETIEQIQLHLSSPSSHSSSIDPTSIVPTLKSQTTSFLALASNVATLQNQVDRLKDEYRVIWRDKTGRVMDPFREKTLVVGDAGGGGGGIASVVGGIGRVEI